MLRQTVALARNTLVDLTRQKVFAILLVFALVAIGSSIFMARLSFQEEFQMLKDVCLGAMSVFTTLLAILATANFLPRDIEERTIYTVLAKPVPRFAYLLGKLGGVVALLLLFTVLMAAVSAVVLGMREATVLAETRAQFAASGMGGSEEAAAAIKAVHNATFTPGLVAGVAMIFVKSALLASLTLLISTFATSALFTVMVGAAVYFVGHLQATARDFWLAGDAATQWWQTLLLAAVALLFPDLQAFNFSDDVVAGAAIPAGLFAQTAALGGVYVAVYFAAAAFVFSAREL